MAGGQVYKSTDWKIIWFNTFISQSECNNYQEKIALKQNFQSQIESIKSQIMP